MDDSKRKGEAVAQLDAEPRVATSRIPGFYDLSLEERVEKLTALVGLTRDEADLLLGDSSSLPLETANQMIENAVGVLSLPLGVGLNFRINDRDVLVPMAVEEPSVVAAVSFAAKIARAGGGFIAECDPSHMIAQVQITGYGDALVAKEKLLAHKEQLLALANSFHPQMVRRGGGAVDIEVRVLPAPEGPKGEPILVLHVILDTQDAMGANLINTVAEGVAPMVEQITGGRVYLRILSNLADRRLARAMCRIPVEAMADFGMDGQTVAEGIVQASRFAEADPYRACTHNKGVMNGVDAVAIATGNDWRAIEAGAHAFAARNGRYEPLSTWRIEEGHLVGRIELPLAVGTVGGPIRIHPAVQLAYKVLKVEGARELAAVMAAVGLSQNLAALRALGSVGIQRGHMALHARCVAVTAGARGELVAQIADKLIALGAAHVKLEKARELLAQAEAGS
ncbi:MAG: hydroxymethylglutaryl-CoA reductase, degradative [Deltaproteobacteria bacterium]|nr:hydroxymethylglutaryl-CoA reductase, degradative [Deltaproteobacteria bacterium]